LIKIKTENDENLMKHENLIL